MARPVLWAVMGPTGSGKTELAEALADARNAALVNADAFQVYRGFDIGTAKPARPDRYRLMDIKEPTEEFGVGEWVQAAQKELEAIYADGRDAVIVGGTGFYIRALFEQYQDLKPPPDPELRTRLEERERKDGVPGLVAMLEALDPAAAATVDRQNPVRIRRAIERALTPSATIPVRLPAFRRIKIALMPDTRELNSAIDKRIVSMFEQGWGQEVADLAAKSVPINAPAYRAIGYQELAGCLEQGLSPDGVREEIARLTKNYAKRQKTWLRREPNLSLVILRRVTERNRSEFAEVCLSLRERFDEEWQRQ